MLDNIRFDKISDYFSRHEEQAFLVKAFLTIFAIILLHEIFSGLIRIILFLLPLLFLLYVKFAAASSGKTTYEALKENITFIPFIYTDGEKKKEYIPLVTYSLILANVIIFYVFERNPFVDPKFITDNLVFIPYMRNSWNVPVSLFTSLFLHGSGSHLWENMIFLWVIGTVVERRIGSSRFLLLYLISGLAANFCFVYMNFIKEAEAGHILGASGAIAGIMGVFAVRCYFKSMVFPIPILGIFSLFLPVSIKIRLNSLVIMGLFFLMDFSGGIGQMTGHNASNIGHWAHVGGMLAGISLAFFLKLEGDAIEERHLEIGARAAEAKVGLLSGERSLRIALEKNPDNAEAILYLARIKSKFPLTKIGKELYIKAIRLMISSKPQEAAEVFDEYYNKYGAGVAPDLQYRLAGIFYRKRNLEMAARCLEIVVKAEGVPVDFRERALYQYGSVIDEMGLADSAKDIFKQFLKDFPGSPAVAKVKLKLGIG